MKLLRNSAKLNTTYFFIKKCTFERIKELLKSPAEFNQRSKPPICYLMNLKYSQQQASFFFAHQRVQSKIINETK